MYKPAHKLCAALGFVPNVSIHQHTFVRLLLFMLELKLESPLSFKVLISQNLIYFPAFSFIHTKNFLFCNNTQCNLILMKMDFDWFTHKFQPLFNNSNGMNPMKAKQCQMNGSIFCMEASELIIVPTITSNGPIVRFSSQIFQHSPVILLVIPLFMRGKSILSWYKNTLFPFSFLVFFFFFRSSKSIKTRHQPLFVRSVESMESQWNRWILPI